MKIFESFTAFVEAKSNESSIKVVQSESVNEESYKVAGRPVTLIKGKKADGTDWKVKFQNGEETSLSDVLALIKPFPTGIKESVNEGIGTIALGVAGGLLLLKVLKFVLKKVVGAIGRNVTLPKEKLLEIVETTVKAVITQSTGNTINMLELFALKRFLEDEINAGKITTIKQIMQVIEANSNESVVTEGKSIAKIQKEWAMVTSLMKDTVAKWKTAQGEEKENLKDELKTLTITKKKLEQELDDAVGMTDRGAELELDEGNAFLAARAKAIEEDAEEFEFNGKTYPVIKED